MQRSVYEEGVVVVVMGVCVVVVVMGVCEWKKKREDCRSRHGTGQYL